MSERPAPRIGLWGGYDVDNFGDALFPRVLEDELGRRLEGADLRAYAPLGGRAGIRALGAATAQRRAELAAELDVVVIGGGELVHGLDWVLAVSYGLAPGALDEARPMSFFIEGLGPELERRCPVAWHGLGVPFDLDDDLAARVRVALEPRAYVSVRDAGSRRRLQEAGVRREILVVPDSVLLISRLHPAESLRAPQDGHLVVQGHRGLLPHVRPLADAIERARSGRPVVLASLFPNAGDGELADALAPLLAPPVHRLADGFSPDDVLAAIACSSGFVGTSLHGAVTATAYGLAVAMINLDGRVKIDGFASGMGIERAVVRDPAALADGVRAALEIRAPAGALAAACAQLDAHFDRLAELALEAARREHPWRRVRRVRRSTITCVLLAAMVVPTAAFAETVTVEPRPGRATSLTIARGAGDTAPSPSSTGAQRTTFRLQRGFKLDLRAVRSRCRLAQARAGSCPASSRIGESSTTVENLDDGKPLTLVARIYLARTRVSGLARLYAVVEEPPAFRSVVIGRIVRSQSKAFGYEFEIGQRSEQARPALSPAPVVRRSRFQLGARRTVRVPRTVRRDGRRVRITVRRVRSLLTTPSRCSDGSWWIQRRLDNGPDMIAVDYRPPCASSSASRARAPSSASASSSIVRTMP